VFQVKLLDNSKVKMAAFNLDNIMEEYVNKTVLAISPRIVNQVTAEKLAHEEMFKVGARPPPANVRNKVVWFPKKLQCHPIRTYVLYEYSAPLEIEGHHLWNASDLEDSLNKSNRKFTKHSNRKKRG